MKANYQIANNIRLIHKSWNNQGDKFLIKTLYDLYKAKYNVIEIKQLDNQQFIVNNKIPDYVVRILLFLNELMQIESILDNDKNKVKHIYVGYLANRFGLSKRTISSIIDNKTHLTEPKKYRSGTNRFIFKLKDAEYLRSLYENCEYKSVKQFYDDLIKNEGYGMISYNRVYRIITGKTFKLNNVSE